MFRRNALHSIRNCIHAECRLFLCVTIDIGSITYIIAKHKWRFINKEFFPKAAREDILRLIIKHIELSFVLAQEVRTVCPVLGKILSFINNNEVIFWKGGQLFKERAIFSAPVFFCRRKCRLLEQRSSKRIHCMTCRARISKHCCGIFRERLVVTQIQCRPTCLKAAQNFFESDPCFPRPRAPHDKGTWIMRQEINHRVLHDIDAIKLTRFVLEQRPR